MYACEHGCPVQQPQDLIPGMVISFDKKIKLCLRSFPYKSVLLFNGTPSNIVDQYCFYSAVL